MTELSTAEKAVSWVFQIPSAVILGIAGVGKLGGEQMSEYVFEALGIPETMLIIGTIEVVSALLLLTKIPHYGALLGFGTMIGALIAHVSVLGLEVQGDGGRMVALMVSVILSTVVVMYVHRRRLPLIGHAFY